MRLNHLLNTDINGALYILKQVVGDGFIQNLPDRGCWLRLVRIRGVFQTSQEQFLFRCYIIT